MSRTPPQFDGFARPYSNVVFTPIQAFNVLLPHRSLHCIRLVLYMLKEHLRWDKKEVAFRFRTLARRSGVSKSKLRAALDEALQWRFITCVQEASPPKPGKPAIKGVYKVLFDTAYSHAPQAFCGFYHDPESEGAKRRNIPEDFFKVVVPKEPLSVVRLVGLMLYKSVCWIDGAQKIVDVQMSRTELGRLMRCDRRTVSRALGQAISAGYLNQVDQGTIVWGASAESRPATYGVNWLDGPRMSPRVVPECPRERAQDVPRGVVPECPS